MISLTKKYSVKHFSDIIGQEEAVSFLRNSLFKKLFYPLYLFSGIRGTGKTTSARLFALSMLCRGLEKFSTDSSYIVPCYQCTSCRLYLENKNEDIIELDAASNTGVEMIRSLINNAQVMSVFGGKKIYIIDEVHMLSKAAFNASLKIMEEPPENVHFILATTELDKVIDTIRSRSILLRFKTVSKSNVIDYIQKIAQNEEIIIAKEAVEAIAALSEGSVRDALNILNRLLFLKDNITLAHVVSEYGYSTQEIVSSLSEAILSQDRERFFLEKKKVIITQYSRTNLFVSFSSYIQQQLSVFFSSAHSGLLSSQEEERKKKLYSLLKILYQLEEIFLTTASPLGVLDILFFSFMESLQPRAMHSLSLGESNESFLNKNQDISVKEKSSLLKVKKHCAEDEGLFFSSLDKSLQTILSRGELKFLPDGKKVTVALPKKFSFYKDFLDSKKALILAAINKGKSSDMEVLSYDFTLEKTPSTEGEKEVKKENIKKKEIQSSISFLEEISSSLPGKIKNDVS
jgi:DNA polymerase-3 subunit gamma/tau